MGWFRRKLQKPQNADADRPGTPIVPKQHVALIGEGTLPGLPHDGRYWVMRTDAYDDGDFRLLWERAATDIEAKQLFKEFAQLCGARLQRVTQTHRDDIDGFWVAPPRGRVQSGLNIIHPQNIGASARYQETRTKWGLSPDPHLNELRGTQVEERRTEVRHRGDMPRLAGDGISHPGAEGSAVDLATIDRGRFAHYLRHKHQGLALQDFNNWEILSAHLDRLAVAPESWPDLDEEWLSLLAFQQLLSHGASHDHQRLDVIQRLYQHIVSRLSVRSRLALEADIARHLNSTTSDVKSLGAFMYFDPAPAVISTAAMDVATLMPTENGDALTGPASVAEMAMDLISTEETRPAAMIAGLLLLGDTRVLPMIAGCWHQLGKVGKDVLREQQSEAVFAATVEFFLQWIETVDEDDFGHPAGALARLAEGMVRHPGVRDIQRQFPAPFNQSDEEFLADPPIRVLQEWTTEEFAQTIEPRLRVAFMRETYDKIMPRVLRAWGLEAGEDDREAQERLIVQSYEQAAKRLASFTPVASDLDLLELQAMVEVAGYFQYQPAPLALSAALQEVWRLQREANDLRERGDQAGASGLKQRAAAVQLDTQAEAKQRLLQHHFGFLPQQVGSALGTMVLLWPKHRPVEVKGSLPNLTWIKQLPLPLWPEFVHVAFMHLLGDGEATAQATAQDLAEQLLGDATKDQVAKDLYDRADTKSTESRARIGAAFMANERRLNADIPSLIWDAFAAEAESRALREQARLLTHTAPDVNELREQPAVAGEREPRRRLTGLESGKALSTALETLGSAAEDWHRVITAPQARNAGEFIEKWKPASEAPAKVDRGLADLLVGFPPDDYMNLYEVFVLAVNALMSKWQADLAALSLGSTGRGDEARVKLAESEQRRVEFYRFWRLFQETFWAMEREQPTLITNLRVTADARAVVDKQDWFPG